PKNGRGLGGIGVSTGKSSKKRSMRARRTRGGSGGVPRPGASPVGHVRNQSAAAALEVVDVERLFQEPGAAAGRATAAALGGGRGARGGSDRRSGAGKSRSVSASGGCTRMDGSRCPRAPLRGRGRGW